jgi:hypothetical protein
LEKVFRDGGLSINGAKSLVADLGGLFSKVNDKILLRRAPAVEEPEPTAEEMAELMKSLSRLTETLKAAC